MTPARRRPDFVRSKRSFPTRSSGVTGLREPGTRGPADDRLGDPPGGGCGGLALCAALEGALACRTEAKGLMIVASRRMKSFLRKVNSSSTRRRSASWIRFAVLLIAFTTA